MLCMKKMVLLLLLLLAGILCSCVPTPEEEVVVGKLPSRTERMEQNAHKSVTEQELSSEAVYEECVPINKGFLREIQFEAKIKSVNLSDCSIYTITPTSFDETTIEQIIHAFAAGTRMALGDESFTIEDIQESIAHTLLQIDTIDAYEFESEAEKERFLEALRQDLKDLQSAYLKAQDAEIEFIRCEDITKLEKAPFMLIDDSGKTVAQGILTCGIELGDPRSSVLSLYYLGSDVNERAEEPDARQIASNCDVFLKTAGIEGFELNQILTEADNTRIVYTRTVAGIPYSYAFEMTELQSLDYFEGSLFPEPYWLDESIQFTCRNNQVDGLTWYSKSECGSAVRDHVAVLPFDEAKEKIVRGLTFQYSLPIDEMEESHRILISTVQFGYKRVPAYAAVGQYELIPAWTVIGKKIPKYRRAQDAPELVLDANNEWAHGFEDVLLVISAMDGSIIG